MMSKKHKEMNAKVGLAEIFKTPTIKGIASLVKAIHWVEDLEVDSERDVKEVIV